MMDEISNKFSDFKINCMHPHGPAKQSCWPLQPDKCWLAEDGTHCV